jgi:hypothetical protein
LAAAEVLAACSACCAAVACCEASSVVRVTTGFSSESNLQHRKPPAADQMQQVYVEHQLVQALPWQEVLIRLSAPRVHTRCRRLQHLHCHQWSVTSCCKHGTWPIVSHAGAAATLIAISSIN